MVMTKNDDFIEISYEELEQYDGFSEDLMEKRCGDYAELIGSFLMEFSSLEHDLDVAIANLINERSHIQGYLVIKNLSVDEKIELLYTLALPNITSFSKDVDYIKDELVDIRDKCKLINLLRNKIAHAKWYSLDEQGFVRVDIKTKKDDGFVRFKKYKITPKIIKIGIVAIRKWSNTLRNFNENIYTQI